MKLHELWRARYQARRYMEFLTDAELRARFQDVLQNTCTLGFEGKVGLTLPEDGGRIWLERFTHILDEFAARGAGAPAMSDAQRETFPINPDSRRAREAVAYFKSHAVRTSASCLVKFGKAVHLERMFNRGEFRIANARSYADPSLRDALQDDEISKSWEMLPTEITIEAVNKATGAKRRLTPIGTVKSTSAVVSDYHVLCFAMACDIRLFHDFDADACLVIREPRRFMERLEPLAGRTLSAQIGQFGPVDYYDPLNSVKGRLGPFDKHFRFAYQKEFRFAWLPRQHAETLSPVFLSIGSLEDCAELIRL